MQTRKYTRVILLLILLAGCGTPPIVPTPTAQLEPTGIAEVATNVPTVTPIATVTLATPEPLVTATPSETPTPEEPTLTPSLTPTLGPYEHLVQPNETLGYIIQLYGYTDLAIYAEIVRINPNVPNPDTLPVGEVILIPRQTATPTPTPPDGESSTDTAALSTPSAGGGTSSSTNTCHTVRAGETVIGIAEQYRTNLAVLAQLNPDPVLWNGCNFELPGGGPACAPVLVEGQCFNVPAPTPVPTLSPTPSGSETPTPTPTYQAPRMVYPPDGAVVEPGSLRLQWVSVGVLAENEVYLVEITDTTSNHYEPLVTRNTSVWLPDSLTPTDGQTHVINWTVSIASPDPVTGVYIRIGAAGLPRTFQWRSR